MKLQPADQPKRRNPHRRRTEPFRPNHLAMAARRQLNLSLEGYILVDLFAGDGASHQTLLRERITSLSALLLQDSLRVANASKLGQQDVLFMDCCTACLDRTYSLLKNNCLATIGRSYFRQESGKLLMHPHNSLNSARRQWVPHDAMERRIQVLTTIRHCAIKICASINRNRHNRIFSFCHKRCNLVSNTLCLPSVLRLLSQFGHLSGMSLSGGDDYGSYHSSDCSNSLEPAGRIGNLQQNEYANYSYRAYNQQCDRSDTDLQLVIKQCIPLHSRISSKRKEPSLPNNGRQVYPRSIACSA